MRPRRRQWERRGQWRRSVGSVVVAVCTLAAASVAGCTTARNTLGTNASSCFEALAIAANAVGHRGSFTGVHLVSFPDFSRAVHLSGDARADAGPDVHDICVVSYRGSFRRDQVQKPLGPGPAGGVGHYAVVVVSKPQNHLVGTVVLLTQPLRFGHPV